MNDQPHPPSTRRAMWSAFATIALITWGTAALGGWASAGAPSFYQSLTQPAWAPPAHVFGPVWTVLYLLMTLSACLLVQRVGVERARTALGLFGAQLVLNGLWSWLFFRWHLGAVALLDIALLLVLIMATTALFWRSRPLCGWLMLPYLAWVAFAFALNAAVWWLNPALL